ncbi:MAG: hypothetical protein IKX61_01335 [Prevotella sp.]|nr:hypothetical protein [Prevotella sp.]
METTIAQTILSQLGGRQFVAMTGAKNLVAMDNGLRFKIGRNASRANLVKVILRGDDTYTMQFWQYRDFNPNTILMRCFREGLSREEFNAKAKEAIEKAQKAAEPKLLKEYAGIYCDQLQELFTDYTKLNTRLF